jgi:hypothetical protein
MWGVLLWKLYEQHDRVTPGHTFQPHPPQPILYECEDSCVIDMTAQHLDTPFSHILPSRFHTRVRVTV